MDTQPVPRETPDLRQERLAELRQLIPEAFSEGVLDYDKLRLVMGDETQEAGRERYSFSWAGKRDAIRMIQTPSRATLIPVRDESVGFDTTQNVFIEGENLEVLKLMYKSYYGRVKMIYIDPPYNTGNDFVYPDNFTDPLGTYLALTGQKDEAGNLLTSNPETSGRYHSAWLSMMYPRLFLARQLLSNDGVIFISIDDRELGNLLILSNEVFGEENRIGVLVWQSKKGGGSDNNSLVIDQEYVVCYCKDQNASPLSKITLDAAPLDLTDEKGAYRRGRELNKWGSNSRRADRPTMWFPIPGPNGEEVYPIRNDGSEGCWRWGRKKLQRIVERGDVEFVKRPDNTYIVYQKIRTADPRLKPYRSWLTDVGITADGSKTVRDLFDGKRVFDFAKPVDLLKHLINIGTWGDDEIALDFFAGSCTLAQAVLELNRESKDDSLTRRFICVQYPERTPGDSEAFKAGYKRLSQLGISRISRVIKKLENEVAGQTDFGNQEDLGVRVFTLVPSCFSDLTHPNGSDKSDGETGAFIDRLLSGWLPDNVIYEVALKEGYSLNCRVEITYQDGNTIYRVTDPDKEQSFRICLDDRLLPATVTALTLQQDDLFICRDIAIDDTMAANLALQCRLETL